MWTSPRDMAQALRCAVQAPVRFGVYYVTSDNAERRWDLTGALVDLGYRPQDDWHRVAGRSTLE